MKTHYDTRHAGAIYQRYIVAIVRIRYKIWYEYNRLADSFYVSAGYIQAGYAICLKAGLDLNYFFRHFLQDHEKRIEHQKIDELINQLHPHMPSVRFFNHTEVMENE